MLLVILGIIAVIGLGIVLTGWLLAEIDRINDNNKDAGNRCSIDDYKFFARK